VTAPWRGSAPCGSSSRRYGFPSILPARECISEWTARRRSFLFGRISSFFSLFLSSGGLLALSFVDSSIFFFTPLATDLVVIILVARHPDSFWLYPAIAVVGSVSGMASTFWIGRKIGEVGLKRFLSPRKLERVRARLKDRGAFAAGALAIAPPPFPFTAIVLSAGALEVKFLRFLGTAGLMRAIRFGAETALARRYGESIIGWLESPTFKVAIGAFIGAAVLGTAFALYQAASRGRR
jgi:membrane protein YqaA with SNARE-associated domain